jgi:hypothetical protein
MTEVAVGRVASGGERRPSPRSFAGGIASFAPPESPEAIATRR